MPCANNDNRKPLKEVSIQETLSHAHTYTLAHTPTLIHECFGRLLGAHNFPLCARTLIQNLLLKSRDSFLIQKITIITSVFCFIVFVNVRENL